MLSKADGSSFDPNFVLFSIFLKKSNANSDHRTQFCEHFSIRNVHSANQKIFQFRTGKKIVMRVRRRTLTRVRNMHDENSVSLR